MNNTLFDSNNAKLKIEILKKEYEIELEKMEHFNESYKKYDEAKTKNIKNMALYVEVKKENENYKRDFRRLYISLLIGSLIVTNSLIIATALAFNVPGFVTIIGCTVLSLLSASFADQTTEEQMHQRTSRYVNYDKEKLNGMIERTLSKINRCTTVMSLIDDGKETVESKLRQKRESIAHLNWELSKAEEQNEKTTAKDGKVLRLNRSGK